MRRVRREEGGGRREEGGKRREEGRGFRVESVGYQGRRASPHPCIRWETRTLSPDPYIRRGWNPEPKPVHQYVNLLINPLLKVVTAFLAVPSSLESGTQKENKVRGYHPHLMYGLGNLPFWV